METIFIEEYQKLSDMKPGDMAVSKNRESFFVCGNYFTTENLPVIFDLNDLANQYTDKRDMDQPIKILTHGDRFVSTR